MDAGGMALIITAITGLVTVWLNYNQHTKNKMTDHKIEKWKREEEEKRKEDKATANAAYAKIYGFLNDLLFSFDPDRIYIVQPHPPGARKFISMSMEIVTPRREVVRHKSAYQNKNMSDWAYFVSRLEKDDFIFYRDVNDIKDDMWRIDLKRRCVKSAIYAKLKDSNGVWRGTICAEFTNKMASADLAIYYKGEMEEKASYISHILPDYDTKE